ncbi:hypothetical protein K492DRAFT_200460 [Lichtheimia hyalospora FSU 10163]|nr:hypothetical protein K492DRAFT_200460 [Lichtheimia hyalospora FSU 10163]
MFKKTVALIFAISMILGASATPVINKRSSCQLGGLIPSGGGGNAVCSAHCFEEGNIHGGHCNEDDVMLKKTLALVFALSMVMGTTTAALTNEQQTDLEVVCTYGNPPPDIANFACSDICRQQGNASGSCDEEGVCNCKSKQQKAKPNNDAEVKHDSDDEKN